MGLLICPRIFFHLSSVSTCYVQVLLTTCKVMAPFTPFFTEILFQNLRKVVKGSEESIHYCSYPSTSGKVLFSYKAFSNVCYVR